MTDDRQSLDRIFGLLANQRRRYVLYALHEAETTDVTLDDIADQLVAWERQWDDRDDREKAAHRERICIALHQNHLPQLAEAGLIDYDTRSQTVRNWEEPSLKQWAKNNQNELQHLRAVFTTSVEE